MAIRAENIDEAAAEQARQRAEERLKQKLSDEDHAMVEATLTHALTLLQVKRRRKV